MDEEKYHTKRRQSFDKKFENPLSYKKSTKYNPQKGSNIYQENQGDTAQIIFEEKSWGSIYKEATGNKIVSII